MESLFAWPAPLELERVRTPVVPGSFLGREERGVQRCSISFRRVRRVPVAGYRRIPVGSCPGDRWGHLTGRGGDLRGRQVNAGTIIGSLA